MKSNPSSPEVAGTRRVPSPLYEARDRWLASRQTPRTVFLQSPAKIVVARLATTRCCGLAAARRARRVAATRSTRRFPRMPSRGCGSRVLDMRFKSQRGYRAEPRSTQRIPNPNSVRFRVFRGSSPFTPGSRSRLSLPCPLCFLCWLPFKC